MCVAFAAYCPLGTKEVHTYLCKDLLPRYGPRENLNVQMQDDEEKKVKAIFLMCAYSSRHHFQFGKVNQHSVPS